MTGRALLVLSAVLGCAARLETELAALRARPPGCVMGELTVRGPVLQFGLRLPGCPRPVALELRIPPGYPLAAPVPRALVDLPAVARNGSLLPAGRFGQLWRARGRGLAAALEAAWQMLAAPSGLPVAALGPLWRHKGWGALADLLDPLPGGVQLAAFGEWQRISLEALQGLARPSPAELLELRVHTMLGYRMRDRELLEPRRWAAPAGHPEPVAEGVLVVPLLAEPLCGRVMAEVARYREWLRTEARVVPAEMIVDALGLQPVIAKLASSVLIELIRGRFGGSAAVGSLDQSYGFLREYTTAEGVAMHQDSADFTINAALTDRRHFNGSSLSLCGEFGSDDYRQHLVTIPMEQIRLGAAVVHSGLRRHGAEGVTAGRRMQLVIWLSSSQYKDPEAVDVRPGRWEKARVPDSICMSPDDYDFIPHDFPS